MTIMKNWWPDGRALGSSFLMKLARGWVRLKSGLFTFEVRLLSIEKAQ
jgi:hypothetical protein